MNQIEKSFNEWHDAECEKPNSFPTLSEAFAAGYAAGVQVGYDAAAFEAGPEIDARLVILARQEIAIEQQKARLKSMGEGVHKARESVLSAMASLDKLRDNSWMF